MRVPFASPVTSSPSSAASIPGPPSALSRGQSVPAPTPLPLPLNSEAAVSHTHHGNSSHASAVGSQRFTIVPLTLRGCYMLPLSSATSAAPALNVSAVTGSDMLPLRLNMHSALRTRDSEVEQHVSAAPLVTPAVELRSFDSTVEQIPAQPPLENHHHHHDHQHDQQQQQQQLPSHLTVHHVPNAQPVAAPPAELDIFWSKSYRQRVYVEKSSALALNGKPSFIIRPHTRTRCDVCVCVCAYMLGPNTRISSEILWMHS